MAVFSITLMILRKFISPQTFTVYLKTQCGAKFHFGQID